MYWLKVAAVSQRRTDNVLVKSGSVSQRRTDNVLVKSGSRRSKKDRECIG